MATNQRLTECAVNGKFLLLWKTSCALSSMLIWVIILIVLDFVVIAMWAAKIWDDDFALALITTFLASPLVAIAVNKLPNINYSYWNKIAESLENCALIQNDNQKKSNLVQEKSILTSHPNKKDREIALNKILNPDDYKIETMNL